VIAFIVGVWVGIAIGYATSALVSERRNRVAEKRGPSESLERAQQKHIDRLKLMAMSVRPVTKSKR
jgi:hypothetical protein